MQSLDQNETAFVGPNENGSLLSDFQNASRDLFNDLRLDFLLPFHGNVNLGDWEAGLGIVFTRLSQARRKHTLVGARF